MPAHSGVESRGEANGLFANLATLPPLNPSGHSEASLDLLSALVQTARWKRDIIPHCMNGPPTGGSHGKLHPTARILSHAGRRGGVAGRGARAAGSLPPMQVSRRASSPPTPATQSALSGSYTHLKKCTTFYTVSATKARAAASRGVALARTISSVPRLALRQKAVRRSHRLRHDNWVIGSRCGRNSFSSGTTSVLRAVFASRDEPMASAPALPEATVSGQFVQIFGRKENPRGGDVLVKVRHR